MNIRVLFENKSLKKLLIIAVVFGILFLVAKYTAFGYRFLTPAFNSVYKVYLLFPEWIANRIFSSGDKGVFIQGHQFIFEHTGIYQIKYNTFLSEWPKYLMYKRFSLLLLSLIWVAGTSIRKRVLFTILFLFTHLFSVIGGLFFMGSVLPELVDESTHFISPTLVGTLAMFILLLAWVLLNKEEIRNSFQKFNLKLEISNRRINEIVFSLLIFLILGNYIIPFIAFKPYVIFLLEITRKVAYIFGFEGDIIGDQLVGMGGALALSKHCLGFMTMFLFSALVFLTRPQKSMVIFRNRPVPSRYMTSAYIFAGLIFIFILNLLRLLLVFIIAQGEDGYNRASLHHEIYNIAIYVVIFILWVIWFELIRQKPNSLVSRSEIQ